MRGARLVVNTCDRGRSSGAVLSSHPLLRLARRAGGDGEREGEAPALSVAPQPPKLNAATLDRKEPTPPPAPPCSTLLGGSRRRDMCWDVQRSSMAGPKPAKNGNRCVGDFTTSTDAAWRHARA